MSPRYKLVKIGKITSHLAPRTTPGTHIAFKTRFENLRGILGFLYPFLKAEKYFYHHGVCISKREVIDFSANDKGKVKPHRCDIAEFMKGSVDRILYRVEYDNTVTTLSIQETLKKAEAVLKSPETHQPFHIIENNCESFAHWLKTDKRWSTQAAKIMVNQAIYLVAILAAVLVSSEFLLKLSRGKIN